MRNSDSSSIVELEGMSAWSAAAFDLVNNPSDPVDSRTFGPYTFTTHFTSDSVWVIAGLPQDGKIAFRIAYCPGEVIEMKQIRKRGNKLEIVVASLTGEYKSIVEFMDFEKPILHYTTSITPRNPLIIPFSPRDMNMLGKNGNPKKNAGKIHMGQFGGRTGMQYVSMTEPASGSLLYFQNLTAISDYCGQTGTMCNDVVSGNWPELGFQLPAAPEKPLEAGKEVVVNDAFVIFDKQLPKTEAQMVNQFMDLLSEVYLQIPKPETHYKNWPEILEKGLHDLMHSPACWSMVKDHLYFNAYVADYKTPPEIMVQLAVMLPLIDYIEWNKSEISEIQKIRDTLPEFFDPKLGTIVRWLPVAADKLEGDEDHKKPDVMDSWYLYHPLLNLSRLALKGDKVATKLFLDSIGYAIKVAHHFNYRWPVLYKMDTLEVVRAETKPGMGGEKDVAGSYAHVMLQAWELTREKKYLDEAEKAARTLEGLGFELFFQANNTAFSAGAMLRLWKETKNKLYLELSNLCIANLFKNMHLWDCNFGYGKNFSNFFAIYPLSDAPYTAVYEESEVFCALHDYLKLAEGETEIPASIILLTSEYIRYLVDRAVCYYPTMLPRDMIEESCKVGELNPNLWIALEDIQDGWEKSGSVGQEVYGAGNAFGILPRHYIKVKGNDFLIYADYPYGKFKSHKSGAVSFRLKGDERITSRLLVIPVNKKLADYSITVKTDDRRLKGKTTRERNMEYLVNGNRTVTINIRRKPAMKKDGK